MMQLQRLIFPRACDTNLLASMVAEEVKKQRLPLKVAYVEGDEVTETVNRMIKQGEKFPSLMTGGDLKDWGYTPIYAQYVPQSKLPVIWI
jgi:hypothetical protein